jgi:hypothetical protein
MSRLFPRDTRILATGQTGLPHLRILAGVPPDGPKVNVMLVNDTNEARIVTVCVAGAGRKTLLEYHYFDTDHPIGADGLPAPKESIPDADLDFGVPVAMPSRGVVFLSMPQ